MVNRLVPWDFHLRNFAQYQQLDFDAATDGNVTFLGENKVGKTTLANTFFPMLVDGSIKTPSFNAARDTDVVGKSDKLQNSPKDYRNFNSMLLGWGSGAYAIRTGYSYMRLHSATRQVTLGIGATRQKDGRREQTWWFVIELADPESDLDLNCTDAQGDGLSRKDFESANQTLGDALHLFTTADAYRNYVAQSVYGFDSGKTLGYLANAYRLLASPILTGGSARFTPIPKALREAQEPIDSRQIIRPVAESHRQLNQMKATQIRLQKAIRRLKQLRRELFWSNLNQLQSPQLRDYVAAVQARDQANERIRQIDVDLQGLDSQLGMLVKKQTEGKAAISQLQAAIAAQANLKQQKQQIETEIQSAQKDLTRNSQAQAQVQQYQADLVEQQQEANTWKAQLDTLVHDQIQPLEAKLMAQSAGRRGLTAVLAQTQLNDIIPAFRDYLTTYQQQLDAYLRVSKAVAQTSKDVKLVQQMEQQMHVAIDNRVKGGLSGRVNSGLHEDNTHIHENGASEMNAAVKVLLDERQQLLNDYVDLAVLVKNPVLLQSGRDFLTQLEELNQRQRQLSDSLEQNQRDQNRTQNNIKNAQGFLDDGFDAESAQNAINDLVVQLSHLYLDETLQPKLIEAEAALARTDAQKDDFQRQQIALQSSRENLQNVVAKAQTDISRLSQELEGARNVLLDFLPEGVEMPDLQSLIELSQGRHKFIDQHQFMNLQTKIENTIAGGNQSGHDVTQALDTLFEDRGYQTFATALAHTHYVTKGDLMVLPIDINAAIQALVADSQGVDAAVSELTSGNEMAMANYLTAAATSIDRQYDDVETYNQMLSEGQREDGIRLQISLHPDPGATASAIEDILKDRGEQRLAQVVNQKVDQLVKEAELADDEDAYFAQAETMLDTRQWSTFQVEIFRNRNAAPELVNDRFVQSGGSGAEKAQAMVLPLLLVPKMRLSRATKDDAPHLVMFDEFADKLDPATARAFVRTITNFGFNFIATMPSGGQNKVLADGVANRAYEVLGPKHAQPDEFHPNQLVPVVTWKAGFDE
ncbi:SbcC/MukB-like Walker B domain-containing protein [Lacticaseibacillus porcinae]|uniref:SbcC/MukB-like Walker B domain-containing protein n=1 Tax=Lacticaseibacillus porcinae TaxID=1123687 RepID=UPI001CDCA933|nr:SbcC/MukB-like Walker B domain-containing protein [Lacticaseibacillus porcinae]